LVAPFLQADCYGGCTPAGGGGGLGAVEGNRKQTRNAERRRLLR
jgi:hypothetical protein